MPFFALLIAYLSVKSVSLSDAASFWQMGLQDGATPIMEGIINFHNHIMFFIVVIVVFVSWLLFRCVFLFDEKAQPEKWTHSTLLEIVWTIFPAFVLLIIAVPSFALLFSIDEILDPAITLKIIGNQWYWRYEYSDYCISKSSESLSFDSYMLPESDSFGGGLRLLEVDNRLVLPSKSHIRILVTASDVLHSWAIPSFGVKIDACPGRLNQAQLFIKREGTFYGQCSEICGVNHAYMPIVIEVVDLKSYIHWIANRLDFLSF